MIKNRFSKMIVLIGLLGTVLSSSGCFAFMAGAAAGAGGFAWVKGSLQKEYKSKVSELHAATLKAFEHLELTLISERKDRLSAVLKGEFADGQDVSVKIKALTEYRARLTIRVGVLGDLDLSERILSTIERFLLTFLH